MSELDVAFAQYKAAIDTGHFEGSFNDWKAMDNKDQEEVFAGRMTVRLGKKLIPEQKANTYTHDRWNKMIEETFEEVRHLAKAKGGEYSGDVDRLLNFRRNGAALGLPMETIWGVYAAKHWDALMQYIRDLQENKQRERLESIDGRIRDLIVYLLLFQAMVDERHN